MRFARVLTDTGRRFGTRLIGRGLLYSAVALLFTAGGVLIASNPALKSVWSAWSFETSPDSEHSTAEQSKQQLLNQHLINHAVSSKFRARGVYQEMRPYANVPPALKKRSLVSGALTEPGGLEVAPLIFYNDHELHMMFHAGSGLCGFVGLLHGGFIATVMDEGMARCAFESLPSGFGFTAHLAINYLKPLPQDSFYLLTAKKSKSQGRKVWVTGTIQKLQDKAAEDVVLVSADGLFIEPKFAKVRTPFSTKNANISSTCRMICEGGLRNS